MTRILCLMVIPASLLTWTPSPPSRPCLPAGHQSDEEAAVLGAMDRYMTAISANDLQAMAAMQTPDGMTYRARVTEGGDMDVVAQDASQIRPED